jgi:hypothetical protein
MHGSMDCVPACLAVAAEQLGIESELRELSASHAAELYPQDPAQALQAGLGYMVSSECDCPKWALFWRFSRPSVGRRRTGWLVRQIFMMRLAMAAQGPRVGRTQTGRIRILISSWSFRTPGSSAAQATAGGRNARIFAGREAAPLQSSMRRLLPGPH